MDDTIRGPQLDEQTTERTRCFVRCKRFRWKSLRAPTILLKIIRNINIIRKRMRLADKEQNPFERGSSDDRIRWTGSERR